MADRAASGMLGPLHSWTPGGDMPRLLKRRPAPSASIEEELRMAVEDYLALSRSPLRLAEPGWYELAEAAAWERVSLVAGVGDMLWTEPS